MLPSTSFSILNNVDIYMNNSLHTLIETIENPEIEITDALLVNLVLKYFYAFFFTESVHTVVPLEQINKIFNLAKSYFNNKQYKITAHTQNDVMEVLSNTSV
jgi:hypothetical protein